MFSFMSPRNLKYFVWLVFWSWVVMWFFWGPFPAMRKVVWL